MSRRNFIVLVIALVIVVVGSLWFFASKKPQSSGGVDNIGNNFLSDIFPFGDTSDGVTEDETDNETPNNEEEETIVDSVLELTKISERPVSGFNVYQKERVVASTEEDLKPKTEPTPFIRYVEKATGNIYETYLDLLATSKFSKTTILRVAQAFFGRAGESVIMRYISRDEKTIISFTSAVPKENTVNALEEYELKGNFLPDGILDMAVSPDGTQIFYLLSTQRGVVGVTASPLGDKKVQIFDSPFTEWLAQWPSAKMVTLTTKASSGVPGYMYSIDPSRKNFTKILGNISGLTTLTSPDGKQILYGDSSLALNIFNIASKSEVDLSLRTLPEKCMWSGNEILYCAVPKEIPGGFYPDDWYQGQVSFRDEIWKVNMVDGTAETVKDPGIYEIDGINLAESAGGEYLVFINKKDGSLWRLTLK